MKYVLRRNHSGPVLDVQVVSSKILLGQARHRTAHLIFQNSKGWGRMENLRPWLYGEALTQVNKYISYHTGCYHSWNLAHPPAKNRNRTVYRLRDPALPKYQSWLLLWATFCHLHIKCYFPEWSPVPKVAIGDNTLSWHGNSLSGVPHNRVPWSSL